LPSLSYGFNLSNYSIKFLAYKEIIPSLGQLIYPFLIFSKTIITSLPGNAGLPTIILKSMTPNDQISTAKVCFFSHSITSGAM